MIKTGAMCRFGAVVLVCAVTLAGAPPAGPPDKAVATRVATQPGRSFTLITFNINYGMPDAATTVRTIESSGADIVCLQETQARWATLLRDRLARLYPHMIFNNPPGFPAGGLAVLSKFPTTQRLFQTPAGSWAPIQVVEARTPIGPVLLMNVHLRPGAGRTVAEVIREQLIDLPEAHRKEIAAAFDKAKLATRPDSPTANDRDARPPLIVIGDFNEQDGGAAVAWLVAQQGLADALPQFDAKSETWQWTTKEFGRISARLDHIVYRGLGLVSARVIDQPWSSDHRPVEAVFRSPPPAATQADAPK
jgi:endonuclease/exonuclease/phosphatase (EEP) superfamily protein YafD